MSSDKEDLRVLELKDLVSQLNITISSQNETIKNLNDTISSLNEQIEYLKKKLFGSSSENVARVLIFRDNYHFSMILKSLPRKLNPSLLK